jgi:hypothetical protein
MTSATFLLIEISATLEKGSWKARNAEFDSGIEAVPSP